MTDTQLRDLIIKEITVRITMFSNLIVKYSEEIVKTSKTIEILKQRKDTHKELSEAKEVKKELEGLLYFVKHTANIGKRTNRIIHCTTLEK